MLRTARPVASGSKVYNEGSLNGCISYTYAEDNRGGANGHSQDLRVSGALGPPIRVPGLVRRANDLQQSDKLESPPQARTAHRLPRQVLR